MKNLKPKISILMISLCFLWNHTEILQALHFDAKTADPVETKGKDAPGKGGTPKTTGTTVIPDGARESMSASEHETYTTTDTRAAEGKNFNHPIEIRAFDESRPSTPIDNSTNGRITKTVQDDKSSTQSSGFKLGDGTLTEAAPETIKSEVLTSGDSAPKKSLFETKETASAKKSLFETEELVRTDESVTEKSAQEKAPDTKPEIQTSSASLLREAISNMPTDVYESFKKVIDSVMKILSKDPSTWGDSYTRTIQQDKTITPEQRADLKNQLNANKKSLQDLSEAFKKLNDNPNPTQAELTEIKNQVRLVKSKLSDVLMRAKPDSTIYKDLSKALDDLDPTTAQEIKDSAALGREKLVAGRVSDMNIQSQINAINGQKYDINRPNKWQTQAHYESDQAAKPGMMKNLNKEINKLKISQRENKKEALGYNYFKIRDPLKEATYDNISQQEISDYKSNNRTPA